MTDGRSDRWVKFHVKALNNPIFTDMTPAVVKVFMICLLEANWQDRKWWDGRSEVTIRRGSFPTSILKLSKKYNLTRQELRSAFYNLQKVGSVTIATTTHYTLVTVEKYDTYQGGDDSCNQPNNQPPKQVTTNQQPANNQPTTTLLEVLESVDVVEENTETVCFANLDVGGALFDTSPIAASPKTRKTSTVQYTEDWKRWYAEFPRHESQGAGFKAWQKLTAAEKQLALSGLIRLLPSINERISELGMGRGCPHPATWLNARRWEDEPPVERVKDAWD